MPGWGRCSIRSRSMRFERITRGWQDRTQGFSAHGCEVRLPDRSGPTLVCGFPKPLSSREILLPNKCQATRKQRDEAEERPVCCRIQSLFSEFPRRNQLEPDCLEILEVSCGQTTTIDPRDRSDHSVWSRHPPPLPRSIAHDVAICQRGFLREGEHPVGEPATPARQPLLQAVGALIRPDLLNPEGDLGDCDRWQCQLRVVANQPCDDGAIRSFLQCLRHDIRIEKDQRSTPLCASRFSSMTLSRSMSVPDCEDRRR